MKLDTGVLVTKGVCYVAIGGLTPLAASLAQWANSEQWPPRIIWVVIISSCVVGAFTQLLSFLSSSYSDYMQKTGQTAPVAPAPNGNGNPPPPAKPCTV